MALLRRDPPPIVAVAVVPEGNLERSRVTGAGWQTLAWNVWHDLGEVHYPTSQIARLVSRVDWRVEEDDNADLNDVFGQLTEITRLIALNLEVAGEGWLIQTRYNSNDRAVDARWEVLAVGGTKLQARLDRADVKVRFWNPDPEDTAAADSSVRAALGPATELITYQSQAKSQSRSRIATAGILLRPNSVKPMVDDAGEPVDFTKMIQGAMTAAIKDEDSAAGMVPIDVELPGEEIEQWRHLIFERPYDDKIDAKMERAIKRIALALDIWPELLLGIADVNHWNAWFLAEDTWQGHIAPLAEQVAGTLEVALSEVGVDGMTIIADPTDLLARRSTVRDSLDAAEIGAVGLPYVREAIGATEDDKPTEADIELILRMKGQTEPEEEEPAVEENPGAPETEEDSLEPIAAAAGDVDGGLGVELARIDDQLRAWLDGATEGVIELARSRVGMRVRSKLRGDPRARQIDGVDNSEVVHTIGRDTAADLIDLPGTILTTILPLGERWAGRLARAETNISELIGNLVPAEQWELSRKVSSEALVDDLSIFVEATIDRTDDDMPVPDLRRVVAMAGV